jgi:hypothetical protein
LRQSYTIQIVEGSAGLFGYEGRFERAVALHLSCQDPAPVLKGDRAPLPVFQC